MQGTVKWFSSEKGYGFITSVSGEDHYFNVQSIKGAKLPSNGDIVNFESTLGKKGKRASNVIITAKNPEQKKTRTDARTDQRITCPRCNRQIVPRINFYQGIPEKSYCPFCAAEIKDFTRRDCFIATAVYGDHDCYEVKQLRWFRDTYLQEHILGSVFVKVYYFVSPPIAKWLVTKPFLSKQIRGFLNILVKHITKTCTRTK